MVIKEAQYEKFQEFIDLANKAATDKAVLGMSNLRQGDDAWAWIPSEKAFVTNAIQGIILALVFAFVIILVSTQNIINSIFSILCVGLVILSVLGFFYIKDY
jgi:hypothetical protein